MAIKTENLAILMTDIVGFTEATVQQSRSEMELLLSTHNRILLPIVRDYSGRHIKSIGDALLLAFRSPTDAMLCAMAMQDALYEYNRSAPKDKKIRIRVGASLGEVRVTRNDIFGEPVNLTSRIAGVTPADEIYMSEALHMAMNKAEVPSREVGWKELKGIGQPVRIYNIPRFAVPRLVPDAMSADDLSDLVYPYGGAHLADQDEESTMITRLRQLRRGAGATLKHCTLRVGVIGRQLWQGAAAALARKPVRIALVVLLVSPLIVLGVRFSASWMSQRSVNTKAGTAVKTTDASLTTPAPVRELAPTSQVDNSIPPPVQPLFSETSSKPQASVSRQPVSVNVAGRPAPARVKTETTDTAAAPQYNSINAARRAYDSKKITKEEYKSLVKEFEQVRESELDQAKRDYKAGVLTKDQYKLRELDIKRKAEYGY